MQQQAHAEVAFLCFCYSGLCPDPFLNIEIIPFDLAGHRVFEEGEINNKGENRGGHERKHLPLQYIYHASYK